MYFLPAAMKDMVFQRHSNCGGVERIEKSCGGFQYVSLLITIFNHKILIHDLEFLHFCKEHNKFIIKLLINITPQPPPPPNTSTLPRSVLYWGYYDVLYKYLDSF